jgi:hypothetical protein
MDRFYMFVQIVIGALHELTSYSFWRRLFLTKPSGQIWESEPPKENRARTAELLKINNTKIELIKSNSADYRTDPNYHRLSNERISPGMWAAKDWAPLKYEDMDDEQKALYDYYDQRFEAAIQKANVAA